MTERSVELRSDTFTRPSAAMRRAMYEAEVGDDVWGEDPTVEILERRAAELTGKEAGLFVSSGTQGNLVGVLSHTQPGDEILLGDRSHMFIYEVAGTAVVGGLQTRTLPNRDDGKILATDVAHAIRGQDIHFPRTGCVVIENTHGGCGGRVLHRADLAAVANVAHASTVPVHLDGARVFHAAVALGIPLVSLLEPVDSVTFCLSKGLGAPIGSVLCGTSAYVERARRWRKMLGGGMRQVGILAAAGLWALQHNVNRLAEDHTNARRLAQGLAAIPGIEIDPGAVETNMVFFGLKADSGDLAERLRARGVRISDSPDGRMRAVTSSEVSREDIDYALTVIADEVSPAVPVLT